jgi:2-keto-4-pentenoate hydratase
MLQDESLARGMRAQLSDWHRRLAAGERRVGWKMGYMDSAVRSRLGLPHPMIGFLASGRLIPAGGVCPAPAGANLLAESEVAIQLGRDVSPGSSVEAALAAMTAVAPAIEIVDVTRPLEDMEQILAGNLFHAAVVLGAPLPPQVLRSAHGIRGSLALNGVQAGVADPSSLPLSPGGILVLVADILAGFGEHLCAGDWVITGSVIKPCHIVAGDSLSLDMGSLGQVSVVMGS